MGDAAGVQVSERSARLAWRGGLVIVTVLAAAFGLPTLDGEFLDGDDLGLIRDHALVNHPSWANAARLLAMVHGDLYQPLPMLTFAANYAAGGADPRGYHAVNIALHAANAVLVALLARRLARDGRVGLLTAAFFACHPFATESVAWITGRIILMAGLFALLLLVLVVQRRNDPPLAWSVAATAAWIASLLCKVLPSVPIAAAWCDWRVYERRSRRWYATLAALLLAGGLLTTLAYYTTQRLEYFALAQADASTSWPARVMIASRYYLENYVWPTRLCAWSAPPRDVPFLSARVLIGLAYWVGLAVVAVAVRRRCPAVTLGIGLFAILLAPFLLAIRARSFLTADRYMYLPIVGLHVALAGATIAAVDALRRGSIGGRTAAVLAWPTVAVLLVGWTLRGRAVADVFHDNFTQAQHVVRLYPDDERAWTQWVRTHVRHGQAAQALQLIAQARQRWPDDPDLAAEAGEAYWQLARHNEAIAEFAKAVRGRPGNHTAKYYWGLSLASLGRVNEARRLWREAIDEKSHFLPAATALGRSYRDAGDADEAARWFARAVELNTYHRAARYELALLCMGRQDWRAAARHLRVVLELEPADVPARINLGVCLTRLERAAEAEGVYEGILRDDPEHVEARYNLAELLAARGAPRAEQEYRLVLQRRPEHGAARMGLFVLLVQQQRLGELVELWDRAARDDPAGAAAGWLAFSLALAGRAADAESQVQRAAQSTGALLADWTRVWLRLASGASRPEEIAAVADRAARPPRDAAESDCLRVVVFALNEYSRSRPADPAALYVLARALAAGGQQASAKACARRVTQCEDGDAWTPYVDRLLRDGPTP